MERSFDPMAVSSSTSLRVSQGPTVKSSLEHPVSLFVYSLGGMGCSNASISAYSWTTLLEAPPLSVFPRLVFLAVSWKTAWPNDELKIVHTQWASNLSSLGLRLLTYKMGATVPILCTCCKL